MDSSDIRDLPLLSGLCWFRVSHYTSFLTGPFYKANIHCLICHSRHIPRPARSYYYKNHVRCFTRQIEFPSSPYIIPAGLGDPHALQIYEIFMIRKMPRTRSQSAADNAEIIDPPSNITLIDVARRVVRWARAIHFVATTVEDTDPARTGFID